MDVISKAVLFAVLMSCCLSARAESPEEYVVKDLSKFPYMAMIKFNNTSNCSGAIINAHHILTAAHCVNISGVVDLKLIDVLVGGLNATSNTTKSFKVTKAFVHAKFSNSTFDNDIAILKVNGNLTAVNGTKAIALWNSTSEHTTDCTLAGWTKWKNNNVTFNETLFSAKEMILNENICRTEYVNTNFYNPHKYCGHEHFPICSRGGPLVCKNVIWGIASKPNPCMTGTNVTLFTKLAAYTSWINDTLVNSGMSTILPSFYVLGITLAAYYFSN